MKNPYKEEPTVDKLHKHEKAGVYSSYPDDTTENKPGDEHEGVLSQDQDPDPDPTPHSNSHHLKSADRTGPYSTYPDNTTSAEDKSSYQQPSADGPASPNEGGR